MTAPAPSDIAALVERAKDRAYTLEKKYGAANAPEVGIIRDLATALSECSEQLSTAREDGWLPIETAPKDGASLILSDGHSVGEGFYDDAPMARRAEAGWFWEIDRGDLLVAKNAFVTHWRPLPAPPALADQDQGMGDRS